MDKDAVFGKGALLTAIVMVFFGSFLILVNFYSEQILSIFSFLPKEAILLVSFVVLVIYAFYLWQSERRADVLKYEFVNVVTHKFRTPLTYVTWSLENLKKEQSPEEKIESIRQIENATSRLLEMTDIMIDMANIDQGYSYVFKAESMREIVERTLQLYVDRIKEKGITFNIEMDYNLPLISVDVKRMELVIKVLLENAFTYTPKGGAIHIFVGMRGKNEIQFSIADSGIGINKEDLSHIFSRFYRSQEATGADTEGMGLGLFIAKKIIERHGGKIEANSAGKDKGATFTFYLPLNHGQ